MTRKLQKTISTLPENPGIYEFFGVGGKILYIGKATSLKDRVKSYFGSDVAETRGPKILEMIKQARDIKVIETDSVLEALILEAKLIRQHTPKYNTREKDNKSWNYVVITDEEFPRVFTMRERELELKTYNLKLKTSFGPFPNGLQLKEALKIIRKIFPFRGQSAIKGSEEFYRQLSLSPDTSRLGAKKEYQKTIRNLRWFFEGRKKKIIASLEKEMKQASREEKFERAQEIKRQLFALKHIQDVSLLKPTTYNLQPTNYRIEAYDVAHTSGQERVGVMTVTENGEPDKQQYRKFKISKRAKGDTGALQEILERRLSHQEWPMPKLIVVDGGIAQKRAAENVLNKAGVRIPIAAVTKDEFHKPKNILGDRHLIVKHENDIILSNFEAHRFAIKYHRQKLANRQ